MMTKQGSINVYQILIRELECNLKEVKARHAIDSNTIPSLEKLIEDNKQKLAELEKEIKDDRSSNPPKAQ